MIANQIPIITFKSVVSKINIGDSIVVTIKAVDLDGNIIDVFWDFKGNGTVSDSDFFSAKQIEIHKKIAFPIPGEYFTTVTVMDDDGGIRRDTIKVQVLKDAPTVNAGKDFSAFTRSTISLHASANDTLGHIVQFEWKIGETDYKVSTVDTTFITPDKPGKLICISRATDDDGNEVSDSVQIQILPETRALLDSLKMGAGNLDPVFSPRGLNYVDTIESGTDTLRFRWVGSPFISCVQFNGVAIQGHSDTLIEITSTGYHLFHIDVSAEDTSVQVRYSIAVYRKPSDDASLSGIKIQSVSDLQLIPLFPAFHSSTIEYQATIPDTSSEIQITSTQSSSRSRIFIEGVLSASGNITYHCKPGVSNLALKVISESGIPKDYRIKIYRKSWITVSEMVPDVRVTSNFDFQFWKNTPIISYSSNGEYIQAVQLVGTAWAPVGNGLNLKSWLTVMTSNTNTLTLLISPYPSNDSLSSCSVPSFTGKWVCKSNIVPPKTYVVSASKRIDDVAWIALTRELYDTVYHKNTLAFKMASNDSIVESSTFDTTSDLSALKITNYTNGTPLLAVTKSSYPFFGKASIYQYVNGLWSLLGKDIGMESNEFIKFGVWHDTLIVLYKGTAIGSHLYTTYLATGSTIWSTPDTINLMSPQGVGGVNLSVTQSSALLTYAEKIDAITISPISILQFQGGKWYRLASPGHWDIPWGYGGYQLQSDSNGRLFLAIQVLNRLFLMRYYDPQAEGE